MTSLRINILIVMSCFSGILALACDPGIYGSRCQFKCHCNNSLCTANGECQSRVGCEKGWMGPMCQYQDLGLFGVRSVTTVPAHNGSLLVDGDQDTCVKNINEVTVEFWFRSRLTWLQLIGENLNGVKVTFKEYKNGAVFLGTCKDGHSVLGTSQLSNVICYSNTNVEVMRLEMDSPIKLCSLLINGGRNLAMSGLATQSSTLPANQDGGPAEASRAVDGNTNTNFHSKSCTHTNELDHATPWWNLRLPNVKQNVNRVVIYNRLDVGAAQGAKCCPERLNGFTMDVYNNSGARVFNYIDQPPSITFKGEVIYNLTTPDFVEAYLVNISAHNRESVLTLCEVELYGYDQCPRGQYGPECSQTCHCKYENDTCNEINGLCRLGCGGGFSGLDCDIDCRPGRPLQESCFPPCSGNCINAACNRLTGKCLEGCLDSSSLAPECIPGCGENMFGENCNLPCHCKDKKCDENGQCKEHSSCEEGWFGARCQYQDLAVKGQLTTVPKHNPELITDADDATCLLELKNLHFNFTEPLTFTWMRLSVLEPDYHITASLMFLDEGGHEVSCTDMVEDIIDKRTTDIYCQLNTTVTYVNITLKEPRSVCSVSISGGRNTALNQWTYQTPDYNGLPLSDVKSSNAVDGLLGDAKCARAGGGGVVSPFWTVQFQKPQHVYKFVVHNGIFGERQGFTLTSFDTTYTPVFNYSVRSVNDTDGVTVIQAAEITPLITYVQIVPSGDAALPMLTLCEVEIYGDNTCPDGSFGPECLGNCTCADPSEVCLVNSGGCISGCAAGFYGEGCQTRCTQGLWGIDCRYVCSEACPGRLCNRVNGACLYERQHQMHQSLK
ncbi:unnamed protein product [Lymnaea stagnalis]|uniref:Fucolectin tachylectin-4 pentraxin-1 domain-containing protein n=1 Tax=Lymnaea stagnalis TaxID=6523 RepID=A0AAV2HUJ1_LYMST